MQHTTHRQTTEPTPVILTPVAQTTAENPHPAPGHAQPKIFRRPQPTQQLAKPAVAPQHPGVHHVPLWPDVKRQLAALHEHLFAPRDLNKHFALIAALAALTINAILFFTLHYEPRTPAAPVPHLSDTSNTGTHKLFLERAGE